MAKADLTAEQLRELLNYAPETGIFTWAVAGRGRNVGSPAGSKDHRGYIQLSLGPRKARLRIYMHQAAWLYVHGYWPVQDIDHINHDKSDNRIENLRELSRSLNQQNQIRPHANNKTGFLGVYANKPGRKKPYLATIFVKGRHVHLGAFDTAEEAHAAYVEAKRRLHPAGTL